MIFAAGIGSRLKPFTDFHPKALAPVAGKPALQWAIDKFSGPEINTIVINVHHFAEQIKEYIAQHSASDKNDNIPAILISDESEKLFDTGGGLLHAMRFLDFDESVWLHNADIITDFDTENMANDFLKTGADVSLLISDRESSRRLWFSKDNNALVGWENSKTGETLPTGFVPNTSTQFPAAFGGVHIVNPKKLFPLLGEYSATHGEIFSLTPFYVAMAHKLYIRGYLDPNPYRWYDIGTPEKLQSCNEAFK